MLNRDIRAGVAIVVHAASLSFSRGSVRTGLDRIGAHAELFRGRRIGIITNHTAYDSDGRYIVEVFRTIPGVTVSALFSPEHGLGGTEQAGIKIDGELHPVYRLPVHSLYGKTRKPTSDILADIDVLVFDIQDIGARFYTYVTTMSLGMEAAAENGKPFVVLDRPNPITGSHIDGPVLEPQLASFVGMFPIPVRHGMTVGELTRMFNDEGWLANTVRADLTVIPMKDWHRRMWYDQTGLRFIEPSPNMPDLETAVIYPGLCLLEGTNVSGGRGTNMPFRQFGAPWIDSERLAERLNNLELRPMHFEPTEFKPANSKYKGRTCRGVRIITTDREQLEPFYSGVRIINEICRMFPDKFEWMSAHFDRLCGTPRIREAITTGASLQKLRSGWTAELDKFRRIRNKYLIYRD